MALSPRQLPLFYEHQPLPSGCIYRGEFITPEEERELMEYFQDLPLVHPMQEAYAAKRRVLNFGWSYDFKNEKLMQSPSFPAFLKPLQRKIAKWLHVSETRIVEALVTEYTEGSAIGWHRDNETFEDIIGISLGEACVFRLRPITSRVKDGVRRAKDVVSFLAEGRSAYVLQGDARWLFQHSVPKVTGLRYSITFRTLPASYPTPWRILGK